MNDEDREAISHVYDDYIRLATLIQRTKSASDPKGSPLSAAERTMIDQLFKGLKATVDDLDRVDRLIQGRP